MKNTSKIFLASGILIFILLFSQVYFFLSLDYFEIKAKQLFYSTAIVTFTLLVLSIYKNNKFLKYFTFGFLISILIFYTLFNKIEDYYLQKAISKGDIIKRDLSIYKQKNNQFPENLNEVYQSTNMPKYEI